MELIKRYLHAVRMWLPEKHHADFLPELEDDLKSQIEEKEQVLQRKLDDSEIAEVLKQRGHPMVVATRLMPQQHLIGPAWYPMWRFALRAVIVWILSPLFVLILAPLAALSSAHPVEAFLKVIFGLPMAAIHAAVAITFIVAGLERLQIKINPFETWDPKDLGSAPRSENTPRIPRCETIVEMAAGMMFLLWWVGVITGPVLAELDIKMGPGWAALFWPITVVTTGSVCLATIKLFQPCQRRAYSITGLILQFATLVILAILLFVDSSVIVTSASAPPERLAKLIPIVEWTIQIALLVAVIGTLINSFKDLRALTSARNCGPNGSPRPVKLNP